jgi:hypothetical protein
MKRIAALLLCLSLTQSVQARVPHGSAASAGGGCSQATSYLALNGNYKPTETTALICGLVNQSASAGSTLFSHLFRFYIYESDTAAHSLVDAVAGGSATQVGTPNRAPFPQLKQ